MTCINYRSKKRRDTSTRRLLDRRADGALIRVSAPIRGDDLVGTRGRLLAFASALDARIAKHWPEELPDRELAAAEPAAPLANLTP